MSIAQQGALERIVGGIGTADFAAVTADAIRGFLGFDLAATLLHRRGQAPAILFDDFAVAGARAGIENYARYTYGINPILKASRGSGAVRARDFRVRAEAIDAAALPYLTPSHDEELGFRTIGWPERLEEVGLYIEADGGMVELGFYRARGRSAVSADRLAQLGMLGGPVAAAFDRHRALYRPASPGTPDLSRRERQVVDLLLLGCSSEAIALRLAISRHTVKDHRKHIFRKLGVASLPELFAMQRGR